MRTKKSVLSLSLVPSDYAMRIRNYLAPLKMILVLLAAVGAVLVVITMSSTSRYSMRAVADAPQPPAGSELARQESLGFFDDISEPDWIRRRDRLRQETLFQYPDDPEKGLQCHVAEWMLFNVDPLFSCPHIRKVGGHGDGSKWVCDPHRLRRYDDCLVYSIGSNNNYEFEYGLVELIGANHCEIHVFDPNPKYERPGDAASKNMYVVVALI